MKKSNIMLAASAVCLVMGVFLAGCQSPGKLVSAQTSSICPACRMETRTTAIKGMTYTKCICPSCKAAGTVDPTLATSVRAYVGKDIGDTVHVCERCEAMVEICPVCRKQAGK